jgi:hypothetical protein
MAAPAKGAPTEFSTGSSAALASTVRISAMACSQFRQLRLSKCHCAWGDVLQVRKHTEKHAASGTILLL